MIALGLILWFGGVLLWFLGAVCASVADTDALWPVAPMLLGFLASLAGAGITLYTVLQALVTFLSR